MSDNEEESKVLETHTFEFEGKPFTLTITEPPKNVAELATVEVEIGDLCTHCGRDTSFGSGELLFVNRIPSGADGTLVLAGGDEVKLSVEVTGYMCAECQSVECDECGNKVLDYIMRETKIICSDCEEE